MKNVQRIKDSQWRIRNRKYHCSSMFEKIDSYKKNNSWITLF